MDSQQVIQSVGGGLLTGAVYGISAVGLAIVFGVLRIINFAHGAMIMLGMYAVYAVTSEIPIDPYFLACAVAIVGAALGWLLYRVLVDKIIEGAPEGPLLITLGAALVLQALVEIIFSSDPLTVEVSYNTHFVDAGPAQFRLARIVTLVCAVLFTLAVHFVLQRTSLGRRVRAVAQDRTAAVLMGFDVRSTYAVAFAGGTGAAFFAGGVVAPVVSITPVIGTHLLLMSFVAAVLGGLGNVNGAFLSGIVVGLVEGVGALFLSGTLKTLAIFVVFIVALVLRPEGLFKSS